jgi:hypothetical protein
MTKYLQTLMRKEKAHEWVIAVLSLLYIFMGIETPSTLAPYLDTRIGKILIVFMALTVFASTHLVVGVLALVVAFFLIHRSSKATGSYYTSDLGRAEELKMDILKNYNNFPLTLEEEIVAKMTPLKMEKSASKGNYKPVLEQLHHASPIGADLI